MAPTFPPGMRSPTSSYSPLLAFFTPSASPFLLSPRGRNSRLRHSTLLTSLRASAAASPPPETRRMTIIYTSEFNKHRPPPGRPHPECPERLDVCVDALKSSPRLSPLLDWHSPQSVHPKKSPQRRAHVLNLVSRVHNVPSYLQRLQRISDNGGGGLDNDTYVSPDTFDIALLAASAWIDAVDVAMGDARAAWALARPPGHHATPSTGMGFCLLSNAAIAAKYALDHKKASSVAILDFDVHHGNGTEASVLDDARIRFASSHQWPYYPGTGAEGYAGLHKNVLNIALPQGTSLRQYRSRFEDEMLPFLLEPDSGEKPDLIIVSAGFDALDVDPLAQLDFKPHDYRLFTKILLEAAGNDIPVVFGLEGGYNLEENGLSAAVTESIAGYCLPNE